MPSLLDSQGHPADNSELAELLADEVPESANDTTVSLEQLLAVSICLNLIFKSS